MSGVRTQSLPTSNQQLWSSLLVNRFGQGHPTIHVKPSSRNETLLREQLVKNRAKKPDEQLGSDQRIKDRYIK